MLYTTYTWICNTTKVARTQGLMQRAGVIIHHITCAKQGSQLYTLQDIRVLQTSRGVSTNATWCLIV